MQNEMKGEDLERRAALGTKAESKFWKTYYLHTVICGTTTEQEYDLRLRGSGANFFFCFKHSVRLIS